MSIYCDDPPEFSTITEPVARKQYDCIECSAKIHVGEKYLKCSGKWQGSLDTYRQHLLCARACELIRDDLYGECICFGGLKAEFGEMRVDGWYREKDKYKQVWKKLRSMMARIKWRERKERQAS